jgi:hypothetical protein
MKLSTKIFLPILLISALLILLSGCIPTTTPSPGVTTEGGTITGIFEVPEACCYSNRDHTEGWVPLVDATVSVIDSKGVTHTTKTDSDGKYWLTDVAPGIYYVVTACCACEDMEGVYKDVVEELKEGETYDAGIADCESTALGLMVDFLLSGDVYVDEDCNYYCNCFDEDSQIYASLVTTGVKLRALAINLQSIPEKPLEEIKANADFQEFVVELCDLLEACCVEPGVTPIPPPPPPPDPCLGNTAPVVDSLTPLVAVVGTEYSGLAAAHDANVGDTLTFSLVAPILPGMDIDGSTGAISGWTPVCADIPSVNVIVKITDNCEASDQQTFAITVSSTNAAPVITSTPGTTAEVGVLYTYQIVATDTDCWPDITYSLVSGPSGMTFDGTDTINWTPTCEGAGDNEVTVRATDNYPESTDQTFTITVPECEPCTLLELTIFTNKIPDGYVINVSEFTFNIVNDAYEYDYRIDNNDNSLTFIPILSGNCEGVVHYQWKNVQCVGGIYIPTVPAEANNNVEYPTADVVSSKKFVVCNPPAYNILYLYVGEGTEQDIYKVIVQREDE